MKLTTASKITLFRVALIPAVVALLYADFPGHTYWALGAFILASVSDFIDGYIARHYNQVTNFGKFLDPLADKLLVISVMCVLAQGVTARVCVLIVVLVREFAVTGLRLVAVEGGRVIAAAWSGKVKTASTMVCLCLMLLPIPSWLNAACWAVIAVTTVYSGVEYFVKNAGVFRG